LHGERFAHVRLIDLKRHIEKHKCVLQNTKVRGSSGSPPPFFITSGGKLKNPRAKKEKKKRRITD